MEEITAEEFKEAMKLDPAWASKLTKKTRVVGYTDVTGVDIHDLSDYLYIKDEKLEKRVNEIMAEHWLKTIAIPWVKKYGVPQTNKDLAKLEANKPPDNTLPPM